VFRKAVGHNLKVWPKMDKNRRPGGYYACHTEKQVIAYFLWKHIILQDHVTGGLNKDEELEERSLKLKTLEMSKPAVLRIKKNIYVSKNPCDDCKEFQQRVREKTSIDFNIVSPRLGKPVSKSRKLQESMQFVK
jgi:hypothetical protein